MEITKQYSRRRRNLPIDRLSDLPDSIICHILSFLSVKETVATSVLGRRWRYIWPYVPKLCFHDESEDTINRVLSLYKLEILHAFIITDNRSECDQSEIGTWINFAVERNVERIDIFCGMFPDFYVDFPPCLFTCKTLVYLRLENCGAVPSSVSVCLPCLKILHLNYTPLEDDESIPNLLSGCPVLEDLVIELYNDGTDFKISSPTIKRLTVKIHEESGIEKLQCRLEINAPTLVYLELSDNTTQHIKCGELTSLNLADICLDNDHIDDLPFSQSVVEFIDRLRNVKRLKLHLLHCTKTIESLFSARAISFRNLARLELSTSCSFISKFLENAHNLRFLILPQARAIDGWMGPQPVPICLLTSLGAIKLVDFVGTENRFEVVRYLLSNARVLNWMKTVYPSLIDPNEKIDMLQKISSFRRRSSVCEVIFV